MTTKTRLFPSLGLLTILVAACAPAATPVQSLPPPIAQPSQTVVPALEPRLQPTAVPTEADAPAALPVATSRGPNLEATDPFTVSLAAGQLQLVEFFRFT